MNEGASHSEPVLGRVKSVPGHVWRPGPRTCPGTRSRWKLSAPRVAVRPGPGPCLATGSPDLSRDPVPLEAQRAVLPGQHARREDPRGRSLRGPGPPYALPGRVLCVGCGDSCFCLLWEDDMTFVDLRARPGLRLG